LELGRQDDKYTEQPAATATDPNGDQKIMKRKITLGSLLALATILIMALPVKAQPLMPVAAQWARNMGQSGLRRFYSTGAECVLVST